MTHTKEEYEAFFSKQDKILSDTLDQIKQNTLEFHREECIETGADRDQCETAVVKRYIPVLMSTVLDVKRRNGEL